MINDIVIENLMRAILDYKNKYGVNSTRYEFEDRIISMNTPMLSYFFKSVIGSDRKEHDVIVSRSSDIWLIYNYSVNCSNVNIKLMEDSIINLKNIVSDDMYLKFLTLFIKDVPNCDKERIKSEVNSIKRKRRI